MSEIPELLERYRRGAELVATSLTGAAGPEVDFVPSPDEWSVRQIVAHLADAEIVAAARLRVVIAEENPTIIGYDQDAWAKNLNYARRKPSEALETFRRIRGESYELLKELPEAAYARKGTHSERGPITLLNVVETMASHAESHARQIAEVRAQFKQGKQQRAGGGHA